MVQSSESLIRTPYAQQHALWKKFVVMVPLDHLRHYEGVIDKVDAGALFTLDATAHARLPRRGRDYPQGEKKDKFRRLQAANPSYPRKTLNEQAIFEGWEPEQWLDIVGLDIAPFVINGKSIEGPIKICAADSILRNPRIIDCAQLELDAPYMHVNIFGQAKPGEVLKSPTLLNSKITGHLPHSTFTSLFADHAAFQYCNMGYTRIIDSLMRDVHFTHCDMHHSSLYKTRLFECSFDGSNMAKSTWNSTHFSQCDFTGMEGLASLSIAKNCQFTNCIIPPPMRKMLEENGCKVTDSARKALPALSPDPAEATLHRLTTSPILSKCLADGKGELITNVDFKNKTRYPEPAEMDAEVDRLFKNGQFLKTELAKVKPTLDQLLNDTGDILAAISNKKAKPPASQIKASTVERHATLLTSTHFSQNPPQAFAEDAMASASPIEKTPSGKTVGFKDKETGNRKPWRLVIGDKTSLAEETIR